jgi:hypothetical protein
VLRLRLLASVVPLQQKHLKALAVACGVDPDAIVDTAAVPSPSA